MSGRYRRYYTTEYGALTGIVNCFKVNGIKRAIIVLDLDNIEITVPKHQNNLAVDLLNDILPERRLSGIVVLHLPWWKCWFKRYQTKVTWEMRDASAPTTQ